MNIQFMKAAVLSIYEKITENKEYLIQLDQQNGDGDLGLSMQNGFQSLCDFFCSVEEEDLGKIFMLASRRFNEAAPSSLGTILSIGMMGLAKKLKGKSEFTLEDMTDALQAGADNIMDKAHSKPGEKTILDALIPAIECMRQYTAKELKKACAAAAAAAAQGSERTKEMKSVHGRAAYYADQSIGVLDGGSVVGKLIFEGIADAAGDEYDR